MLALVYLNIRVQLSLIHCFKANVLAKYFSLAFTNEDTANVPVLEGDPLPQISLIHIHSDGVAQLLLNLKVHKAAGPKRSC